MVEALAGKPRASAATERPTPAKRSPWLPPEPDLTVGALGDDYVLVLNKFPVIDRHVLIVTRTYEDQAAPLTASDLEVLARGVDEWSAPAALGFYNGGTTAGASQRHKHLQLVPLPLAEGDAEPLPVDPLRAPPPFRHAATPRRAGETGARTLERFRGLRQALELPEGAPYNLLLTRGWMMLVPRSREHFGAISVNALGFAGCLLARDEPELEAIRAAGPVAVVRAVT